MEESRRINLQTREVAVKVRDACLTAALEAYESAKMSGLCEEGAWEAAVGAMRMVDVDAILKQAVQEHPVPERPTE